MKRFGTVRCYTTVNIRHLITTLSYSRSFTQMSVSPPTPRWSLSSPPAPRRSKVSVLRLQLFPTRLCTFLLTNRRSSTPQAESTRRTTRLSPSTTTRPTRWFAGIPTRTSTSGTRTAWRVTLFDFPPKACGRSQKFLSGVARVRSLAANFCD